MPWGRIHDGAYKDPKLLALSDAAARMYWSGIGYAQAELTDGFIPDYMIHTFGVRAKNKDAVAEELCQVLVAGKGPLWHKVDGGYRIHDFLDWNDSRDDVLAERQRSKHRKDRFNGRKRGLDRVAPGVSEQVVNVIDDAVEAAFRSGRRTRSRTRSGTLYDDAERVPERVKNGVQNAAPNPVRNPVRNGGSTYHDPDRTGTNQLCSSVPSTGREKQEHALRASSRAVDCVELSELGVDPRVSLLRRLRSRETSDGRPAVKVIAALARHVLLRNRSETDDGELREILKSACAKANLQYDGASVGEGIERAKRHLQRRGLL